MVAAELGISSTYMCDIESDNRPIQEKFLDKLSAALGLKGYDIDMMYDLAGKSKGIAPPDLTGYINENHLIRVALRKAKESATEDDLNAFIKSISKNKDEK